MGAKDTQSERTQLFETDLEVNSNKNNLFIINFYEDSNSTISIKAKKKDDFCLISYSNQFTVEKIKENKYFLMCDDLKEIGDELNNRIKMKEISLTEKETHLIITITLPSVKINEIKFQLNEDKLDENEKVNHFIKVVTNLKNEINSIKNENIKLKNEGEKEKEEMKNNFKNEINNLNDKISNQKNEIEKLKEEFIKLENKIFYNDLKNSKILENDEDIFFILSLFPKESNFTLLYQATRDGSYPSNYHQKCDDKGPTLALIKTNDNKKFGGYVSKDRKYGTNEETNAFSNSSIRGVNFTSSLGFYHNCDNGNMFLSENSYEKKNIDAYNSYNDYEFAGKNYFKSIEIEVYQVKSDE